MANSLAAYTPTIIGKTIPILRETLEIQKWVYTDYDPEMLDIGASLQIPVTAQLQTSDITPASTAPALTSITPTDVTLTLNKFKRTPFSVTVSDLNTMMRNTDFVPMEIKEGFRSTARQIVTDLWTLAFQIPYVTGTAGTNPFTTSLATLSLSAKSLNNTLADKSPRVMILNNDAVEKANELGNLIQAYQRGSALTLDTQELGMLQGFMCVRDSEVPTFTSNQPTSTVTTALQVVGASTIAVSTQSAAILVNDVFTAAGDTQTYIVTAVTNGGLTPGTVTFYPPAQVAWASGAAITFKASRVCNLGMDPLAMALAMRQPRVTDNMLNTIYPVMDNQGENATNMQMFISETPNYYGVTYEVGCFYGNTLLRPERAVVMMG